MMRRLPMIPTIVVLLAVGTMVALGVWQLQRMAWKDDLLARYGQAQALSSAVPWPTSPGEVEAALYRHSRLTCAEVVGIEARSGRSARGQSGWAHIARCRLPGGGEAEVAIGWSRNPVSPEWDGGEIGGIVGPAGVGAILVASPAQAGLEQLAPPDPGDIPNNHFAYAMQWFFFALTALGIYALALRRKWGGDAG